MFKTILLLIASNIFMTFAFNENLEIPNVFLESNTISLGIAFFDIF